MRVLLAAVLAAASGFAAAILFVAVGALYIVMQARHLNPPISGAEYSAYGIGMIAYAGVGLVIGLPLGLFVYFKVDEFLRSKWN